MDQRLEILNEFFRDMPNDRLKLETTSCGFEYLSEMLSHGCDLEYGQLSSNLIHKYKLINVPPAYFEELLAGHINGTHNVCCYFDDSHNTACCFNLDNNYKNYDYDTTKPPIDEVGFTREVLVALLNKYGCPPLVTTSGRGYHLWLRLAEPTPNQDLFDFMIRIAACALFSLQQAGYDHKKVKISMYPNPMTEHPGSLRLFGSHHVLTQKFSHVVTSATLLNEAESWRHYGQYLRNQRISAESFKQTRDELLRMFQRNDDSSAADGPELMARKATG